MLPAASPGGFLLQLFDDDNGYDDHDFIDDENCNDDDNFDDPLQAACLQSEGREVERVELVSHSGWYRR